MPRPGVSRLKSSSRRQAGMGCLRGLGSFAGSVSRSRWQVLAEERTRCAGCSHHTYANLSQLQQWRRRYRLLAASAHGRSSKRRWLRSRHSAVFATSQIPRKPIGGQCSKPIDTLIAPAPPAAVSARRPCSALSSLASCGEELLHEPQCRRHHRRAVSASTSAHLSQRQPGHATGSTARTIGSQQVLC